MPILIDGHNLIGQSRDLKLSDPDDEAKLVAKLQTYLTKTQKKITVIFDANPFDKTPQLWETKDERGNLSIRFATRPKKADDVIREIAGETKDRKGLVVVTSDGAVASFARACGIRVQSSSAFYLELQKTIGAKSDEEEKPEPQKSEIDEWLGVFKELPASKSIHPLPFKDLETRAEEKRKKRNEQLKRQTKGGGKLIRSEPESRRYSSDA
jgi:hypothetical protein